MDRLKTKQLRSALAAIGSVTLAGSCRLPPGPFWLAAGVAGASTLLDILRPYLLGLSVALTALGFSAILPGEAMQPEAWKVATSFFFPFPRRKGPEDDRLGLGSHLWRGFKMEFPAPEPLFSGRPVKQIQAISEHLKALF